MKNTILVLFLVAATLGTNAQHNYDNQDLIYSKDGKVGIGSSTPRSTLSIAREGLLNFDWTYESNWGGSSSRWAGFIGFNAYRANNESKDYYKRTNNYTNRMVFEGGHLGFRWLGEKDTPNWGQNTGSRKLSQLMFLSSEGKLGIGTASPEEKLSVNGKILAEEIEVVVDVPADYVFENTYDLKSLEEVKSYIAKNGHLPNIPSAEVLKTKGWNVGEMSNKLLEKIEELTLYTIHLNEQNIKLQHKLKKLEQQLENRVH